MKEGSRVIHRSWPLEPAGIITQYPAVDPDGNIHEDKAEVAWGGEYAEIEDIENLEILP